MKWMKYCASIVNIIGGKGYTLKGNYQQCPQLPVSLPWRVFPLQSETSVTKFVFCKEYETMKWQKEIFEYLLIFLPYLMCCLIKEKGKPFIRRGQHWIAIRVLRNWWIFKIWKLQAQEWSGISSKIRRMWRDGENGHHT